MRDLTLYEPGLLAGMHAQSYDLPLEEAWDAGRQVLREYSATRFVPCVVQEYAPICEMVRALGDNWPKLGIDGPPPRDVCKR